MKWLRKILKILIIFLKIIVGFAFGILLVESFIASHSHKQLGGTWLYLAPIGYPLALGFDFWLAKRLKEQPESYRLYVSFCQFVLQVVAATVAFWLIEAWATTPAKSLNTEGIGVCIVLLALLALIAYLWWTKRLRDIADTESIRQFLAVSETERILTEQIMAYVKQSEIVKPRFHSAKYSESFPVLLRWKGKVYLGIHSLHEHSRNSISNPYQTSFTYRTAFWLFRIDFPDVFSKKPKDFLKDLSSLDLNEAQSAMVESLLSILQKHEFSGIEVKDGFALLAKPFPADKISLGRKPISTAELEEITLKLSQYTAN